jgi:hypothetical protein
MTADRNKRRRTGIKGRLFLQFKDHGKVRTAAFTQDVAPDEEH